MAQIQPVLFGEVLFDCFPDGTKILGGAPFNVAWHLQGFGLLPLLISRIGTDPLGEEVERAMTRWGMAFAGVQLDPVRPTGTVKVSLDHGNPSFTISPDDAFGHVAAGFTNLPPFAPLLYHGTLALWHPRARQVLRELKQSCRAPIFIDVNLRSPWWNREQVLSLLAGASWLKLNEEELHLLSSVQGSRQQKAITMLQEFQLKAMILTRGSKGATIFLQHGEQLEIAPSSQATVVDTVGAGDGFSAVVILGILSAWPMEKTVQRAQEFATAVVGQRGATIADTAFYRRFMKKWATP